MKRITDLIKKEEVRNWSSGDIITISAPTGSGKSYFIKNTLYLVAKEREEKILLLTHRTNCKEQFFKELYKNNKLDTIDIITYQTIENNSDFDFSKYKYIVCDEFHYFTSDSNFNYKTDISLNKILDQTDKVRILMSATGEIMKRYINNAKKIKTKDYIIESSFEWMDLYFFNKDMTINDILDEVIENNEKALVFMDSSEKSYDLYKEYKKYSLYCCSKGNTKYKYVDKDKIGDMLNNEMFDENILFTTTCLDTGVNIIDDSITTIICDIRDVGVLVQCLGRKRRKDGEKVNVYIKNINNNVLGGEYSKYKIGLQMIRDLNNTKIKDWTDKYSKTKNDFINTLVYLDGDKIKVNELMKFKIMENLIHIGGIMGFKAINVLGLGYKDYLCETTFKINDYAEIEKVKEMDILEEYLESVVGMKLFKEQQKELAKVFNIKKDRKILKSIGSLNAYLEETKVNFIIKKDIDWTRKLNDGIKNPTYGKSYWIVYKLVA